MGKLVLCLELISSLGDEEPLQGSCQGMIQEIVHTLIDFPWGWGEDTVQK